MDGDAGGVRAAEEGALGEDTGGWLVGSEGSGEA